MFSKTNIAPRIINKSDFIHLKMEDFRLDSHYRLEDWDGQVM